MSQLIRDPVAMPSSVEVSFAWLPAGTQHYTSPGGLTFSAPNAPTNTPLTFIATTIIDNAANDISAPLTIIEYHWDFGDGVVGYGNPITHTYILPNLQARTTLRVTDSKARQWFAQRPMYCT